MMQQVFIGSDSIIRLQETVQQLSPRKILLVRDAQAYTVSGAKAVIEESIKGVPFIDFFDFQQNPKIEDVERGLAIVAMHDINLIIGIGGGSVMDMAKLIRFLHSYRTDESFKPVSEKMDLTPLMLLPTTAGTGAEATHFAVVYKNRKKYSLTHEAVLADYAFIYPAFTYKIPAYITACTGFDALAQAIEAFWNVNATDESDRYAEKAIQLLANNLNTVVHSPSADIRNQVAEGAYWAGRAINITKTTAPHAFSYPYTTYYGLPHGHAVAMTFPQFITLNYGNVSDYIGKRPLAEHHQRMEKLYTLLHIASQHTAEKQMSDFILGLGLSLSNPPEFNPRIIMDNVNLERLGNNPVKVSFYNLFE